MGERKLRKIRWTGHKTNRTIDPKIVVKPTENQIQDLLVEIESVVNNGNRVLVTTLTKKMSEALSDYLLKAGIKTRYLHSDIDTLERIEILRDWEKVNLMY